MGIANACTILLFSAGLSLGAEAVLPEGSTPAPVVAKHFPDRVHEFVWRNWNLVEPAKLAKVLGTSEANVVAMADSMGLPAASPIPPEMKTRGYLTVIRRNWHILPYDQLLDLIDMTSEQLAFVLREDDFFYCKLGLLKPKCRPLHYVAPDETAKRRAAEIKKTVEEEFGQEIHGLGEARFQFLKAFDKPVAGGTQISSPAESPSDDAPIRFIYSYFAVFGDPLSNPKLDPYPDALLERLSAMKINGVWLHVVLRDLAPGGKDFPEFGVGCEKRLANLRALVARAKKYGIGVYLYMNEPRAMPEAFFKNRPELAGVREGEFTAICTSQPKVRQWMSDSLTHVFREVPDLAGVFSITASENLTSCASHGQMAQCPRCKNRTDGDIIAEVCATIDQGVHRANPKAKVIAWDWGWHGHGDAPDIIAKLPKTTRLMSVSEWNLPIERGGIKTNVGEYSISAVGPGPRATRHWRLAKDAGLKTMAKVQLNLTWELSTIPYLPVMDLVAEHCHRLTSSGVDGMMLSWSLGGYPSPNLEIAARLQTKPTPGIAEVLDAVAVERYGEGAPLARKAWTTFSSAFREYPYACGVIYTCPVQIGPANLLYPAKTGYGATMTGIPYDDLGAWRGPYPPEVFAAQFEKVASGWRQGLPILKEAVQKAPGAQKEDARAELRFAEVACLHFQAVANQARFVMARDALAKLPQSASVEERRQLRSELRRCVEAELAAARREFTLAQEDSRIGFEAANQYFFVPLDLAEKVINCRWLLDQIENIR